MKYLVSLALCMVLMIGLLGTSAAAAGPKPIAVLSLTAQQDLQGDTDGIG